MGPRHLRAFRGWASPHGQASGRSVQPGRRSRGTRLQDVPQSEGQAAPERPSTPPALELCAVRRVSSAGLWSHPVWVQVFSTPTSECSQTAARREGASAAVRSPPSAYARHSSSFYCQPRGRQGSCGSRPVAQRAARVSRAAEAQARPPEAASGSSPFLTSRPLRTACRDPGAGPPWGLEPGLHAGLSGQSSPTRSRLASAAVT